MKGSRAVGTRTVMGRSRRQLVQGFLGNRRGVNYSRCSSCDVSKYSRDTHQLNTKTVALSMMNLKTQARRMETWDRAKPLHKEH